MNKLMEDYEARAVNIVVLASEGASLRLASRHRHAEIHLLWNLDERALYELFQALTPPEHIGFEDVRRLLGGNPAKLVELAARHSWNLDGMLRSYSYRLRVVVEDVSGTGLLGEPRRLLEDIDAAGEETPNMRRLADYLVEQSLLIPKRWVLLNGEAFEEGEPGARHREALRAADATLCWDTRGARRARLVVWAQQPRVAYVDASEPRLLRRLGCF